MPKLLADLSGYLAVLDSNTLLSAAVFPGSVPNRALWHVRHLGRVVFSEETLAEITEVLQRPKFNRYLNLEGRLAFLATLKREALTVEVTQQVIACRDPKDDKFLSLALAARASHLITGDADLLALHAFRTVQIVSPHSFLNA